MRGLKLLVPLAALVLAGCASYTWTSSVPEKKRTVSVPTFRNESNVTELGSIATRQILREFQREGTFRIATVGDAAIEIQGTIHNATARSKAYDRRTGARGREYELNVEAVVSWIDKLEGKVLVDNRHYRAQTTFLVNDDIATGERDASGRVAEDLARQIVDDLLAYKWDEEQNDGQ